MKKTIKHTFVLVFVINLLLSLNIYSQQKGTLRGLVTDANNGESLAYGNALVTELNMGASTDERGYFVIPSIPANKYYKVKISYVGYQPKEINIFIRPNKVTHVDVELEPSSFELQTIEKVGKRVAEKNATDIGLQRISIKELESLPKGVETDIFRSLQYVPGVRTTGDVSAKYYVRGGAGDQNLVLLNGVTVYNPFHALGMFSIFDPEAINNVEFYKGGFSSEFGGRLSSVLKIITKDGNKNKFGAKFSGSYLTAKGLIEGPIPNGSFMITGRKSYSNDIMKKFMDDRDVPIDFYDASFKFNISPSFSPGTKIEVHGFTSKDNLEQNDPLEEDYKWENNLFAFKWLQVGEDTPLFFNLGLSVSTFSGEVIPNLSSTRPKSNDLTDITLDVDFSYVYDSKDELSVGLQIKDVETNLLLENNKGIISNVGSSGTKFNAFVKYEFLRFENFGMDVGSRVNMTFLSSKAGSVLEPRLNLTYNFSPLLTIKGAIGFFQQDLSTLSNEDDIITIFEPWLITPDYLNPSSATHYIVGLESHLTENLTLKMEAYYKDIQNLPAVNQNKFRASDPDFLDGTGEAYGWEALLRYNNDPINFTASYANAWAYKEVEGWLFYPKYDSRHTLNLGLEINLGYGWQTSIMWNFNTGLPFTKLTGYYDKFYIDDYFFGGNYFDTSRPFTLLDDKNLGRLPDYHRLDLSLTKKLELAFMKFELNFNIINVYDRKNIFYFRRDTGKRVNMLPILPTATIKMEL
ncbi:MAG: TonB-dependent receptor [Melioribacteraceae bacterium]|nr:TonB-dependent receptor [Melioribacteraceae bacterium]